MARVAQGLLDFREPLIQLYVDNPFWVIRGTAPQRRRATVIFLLFWQAFDFPFSWTKSRTGPDVPWIGATLQLGNFGPHGRGVDIVVPEDKGSTLPENTGALRQANAIGGRILKKFAGQMSFVAGSSPTFGRSFLAFGQPSRYPSNTPAPWHRDECERAPDTWSGSCSSSGA